MKSIFKLISVGLSIFLLGSCYQKARNVDPNNPNLYDPSNPVSPMQETWDWVGNPPFSVDMDGTPYSKTINNADFTTYFGNPVIWVKTYDGDDFQIQLPEDPVAGEKYSIKGKMSYYPAQGTPSGNYGYLCFGGFVKIFQRQKLKHYFIPLWEIM
jgi:hypothetical protein